MTGRARRQQRRRMRRWWFVRSEEGANWFRSVRRRDAWPVFILAGPRETRAERRARKRHDATMFSRLLDSLGSAA